MRLATHVVVNVTGRAARIDRGSLLCGSIYRQPNVLKSNIASFERPALAQRMRRRNTNRGPHIMACRGFMPLKTLRLSIKAAVEVNKRGQ